MSDEQYMKWFIETSNQEFQGRVSLLEAEIERLRQRSNELWGFEI